MIKQIDKKHKSILNFLYTHQTKDMEKIYFQIKKNEIECDIEEHNKCLIIKIYFYKKLMME